MTTKTYDTVDELPDLSGGKQITSVDELPDLKKKESSPVSSIGVEKSIGGIESTPQSTSPLPSVANAPIESPFEFAKYRNKKVALPANIPRTVAEVSKTLSKVQNGSVDKGELAELYEKDYGKPIVEKLIDEYAPQLGKLGWDKEVFRNEEKWDELSKTIKTKNRTNAAIQQEEYIRDVDVKLQDAVNNLKTTKLTFGGGTGGGTVNENTISIPAFDVNNPSEYGRVIEQLKTSDDVVDSEGNRIPGKKQELINYLDQKAKYFTAQQGVDADVLALGNKVTDAIARSNMQREIGEEISVDDFAKDDKTNEEHFKIGLSYLRNVKPGQYKNILRVIDEGKTLPDDDFREVSEVGQEIYNQQVFFGAATNPELIDKETNLDYTTYSDKKAQYAAIIGERAKAAGLTNARELSEENIKKLAYGLDNKTIVQDLANEEKILGYDAIPKSGVLEIGVQGLMQPFDGIKSTFQSFSESPVETYIRSKKLDTGSGQKVVGEDGQLSGVLPSDRGNIFYDAVRGLGQFIPQVLLTKGIGGTAAGVIAADARVALTPALKSGISTYSGTAISTFFQSYGDSYADYLQKTGDPATARLGATVDAASATAFETFILPDVKIADKALSGLRGNLSNDIIELVKKGGDPATLATKARPFVQKFVTNAINISGQEVAEEVGTQLVDYITESVFSPQTVKDRDLGKELLETAKATAVSMSIPSLLGAGGSSVNQDFTKNAFNSASINFDDYRQALDKQLNNGGITQNDYNDAIKLLSTHRQSIQAAPKQNINGVEIDGQKQLDYAYEDTKIKVYKEKAAASDGVAKEMWESKIKQSEDIQREILMPKQSEAIETQTNIIPDTEKVTIDDNEYVSEQDQTKEEITAAKILATSNLPGIYDEMAEQDPVSVIKEIAQQAQGVNSEGKALAGGNRKQSLIDGGVPESVINKAVELYPASSTEKMDVSAKERSERVTPILTRINDADYINENELDLAANELYDALDEVEKENTFTPEQKENARNLIEPIISKIEGYEFRTKTETSQVAETKATQVAKPTRTREIKPALERSEGKRVEVTTPTGAKVDGVLRLEDGKYVVSNENGDKVAAIGEKAITDRDLTFPTEEEVENPIQFDENDAVKSVTVKDRNGNLITITDPDIALDVAIQLRADAIGEVTPEEFDTVYETIQKEVQQEVLVNPQTNKNEIQQPATSAQPTAVNEPTNETNVTPSQARNTPATPTQPVQNRPKKETVKSLTDELRSLLGNEAAALTGDANPKNRISFTDLGITASDTIEQAIDKLITYGGDFTNIFKAIKADVNFKNVKLQLVDSRSGLENGESGLYYPVGYGEGMDNTLQIANKDNVYYTAAHELLHFLTLDGATANELKNTPSYQALTDMYNYVADKKGKPVAIAGGATIENYGLTNEKEFMAELLINPTFRNYVSDVFAENKDDIFKASKSIRDSKVNSIGDIIYNFFKDIFNKLFSSPATDIPFDEKRSVVDNAAKLATQLFFGGENVIVGQTDSGEGGTVLGMGSTDLRTAALALPGTNRNEQINTFVKSALGRGVNEADLKQALINNGISEADAQGYIDSNKAAPASPAQRKSSTRSDNEIISTVLTQRLDAKTFPTLFSGNEEQQQIAANTQGVAQNREVDGAYIVATEKDLKEISVQSAKLLRDELGKDWGVKTLAWIEQNPSQGNIAQVVGVLNVISTENFQDIQDTHDGNRVNKLAAIQKRIDVVSIQRARDAALGLVQRRLYRQFAQGGSVSDVVANSILSKELQDLQADLNEIVSSQPTDNELNSAPPLKPTTKKRTTIRNVTGTAKRRSNPAIKDELISKGAETAGKTKKTFKELIEDAKNKLNNVKC